MRNLILSKRMEAVAGMVPPHSYIVADVGCDHAYISIKLIENEIAKKIIAMDVRRGPLEIAANNIRQYGCESCIDIRLSDGFDSLSQGEADVIVISGMGGLLIKSILEKGRDILICDKPPVLVLQPQSDIREVRVYLYSHDYHIESEKVVFEDGKYYTVILAYPGIETPYSNEEDWIYGRYNIEKKDEVLIKYLQKEYEVFDGIRERLKQNIQNSEKDEHHNDNNDRTEKRFYEIQEKLIVNRQAMERCMQ